MPTPLTLAQAALQQALAEGFAGGPLPTLNPANLLVQSNIGNPPATNVTPNLGLSLQDLSSVLANNMILIDSYINTIVHVSSVTLSAAQVNALNVTPVVVVPAVTGKTIVPLQINLAYTYGSAAFTVLNNASEFQLNIGTDIGFSSQEMQTFTDQTSSQLLTSLSFGGPGGPLSSLQGQPITMNNPGTPSSGGAG